MSKLKLNPNPTFSAIVRVPIPGQREMVPVRFEFVYKNADELKEWLDSRTDNDTFPEAILEVARSWDLDLPFDKENVELMCRNYHSLGRLTLRTYTEELTGARVGN